MASIGFQVTLMLFGVISARGTTFGVFIKRGTESATTTLSSEKAPKPILF